MARHSHGAMTELGLALPKASQRSGDRAVAYWLLACCAMVFAMVVIGGITRLTHSGLSIVTWDPIMGALPPLGQAEWQAQFDLYKATLQYRLENEGMTLAAFKAIFWWEYVHRLWGRLIGVVFLVPFLYFAMSGRIDRKLAPRLAILFLLGALQGVLGWFMVMSGLAERSSVSQYRLAAHLAAALLIYGYMLALALALLAPPAARARSIGRASVGGYLLTAWILLVALSGAFVAGLHAGLVYNSFPLMDGRVVPAGLFPAAPWYANLFADVTTVQFEHRLLAMATAALVLLFRLSLRRLALGPRARLAANLLALMVLVQLALGIATLLLVVPIPLAAWHQAGALLLFTLALWTAHELKGGASPAA
ncbi:MAG: COX15/CtaA family protein [Alphaproteobacteria bacterium]